MKASIFETVTVAIIALLEAGTAPWRKSWKSDDTAASGFGVPHNAVTGRAYRGLNVLICIMASQANGYQSLAWITPKQAIAAGLNFKGEKCTQITFWKKTSRTVTNDAGDEEVRGGMFCRTYNVLNLDQCTGDKSQLKGADIAPPAPVAAPALASAIEEALQLRVNHGGDKAFYLPSRDFIQMPHVTAFDDEGAYCATLSHEAIHATGAKHRLDRAYGKRFGDDAYAFEELVAELGAAFVGAVTGHSNEVPNHASYLASWLRVLKSDSKAILTAASAAQKAADMVLTGLASIEDEDEDAVELAA